jgi:hypothetical protein
MSDNEQPGSIKNIEQWIMLIRGQRVMLDVDLAQLYNVSPKALNQAVKRNRDRFPNDFMFQLTWDEANCIIKVRSQFVTLQNMPHHRYRPYAFTEQGVAMLSSVLRSKRAIQVNVEIMRAFVKLRGIVANHKELAHKLTELERQIETHDEAIRSLFTAIRQLMEPPKYKEKRIGFQTNRDDSDNP